MRIELMTSCLLDRRSSHWAMAAADCEVIMNTICGSYISLGLMPFVPRKSVISDHDPVQWSETQI